MFTGIIKEIGKVKQIKKSPKATTFTISCKKTLKNKAIGDSISVNGICTTIIDIGPNHFTFDAIDETIQRTNIGKIKVNDEVNLEPALTLQSGIDGHLVQGHVDCIGQVLELKISKKANSLKIQFPKSIECYLAFKGSISINGVSLTIADLKAGNFTLAMTGHTLQNTTLKNLKPKDHVNIEVDMIAKYLENMLNSKEKTAKYEYLKERGFI